MNPSESTISSAINGLKKSPGVFQRLVERYAQVMYPQRFEELIPKGQNQNDVPIKEWPDAFAIMPDGRLDAIEATHSASWRKHIEDDLKKIATLGPTRLGGFIFVAWAPTPSVEIVQEYYDRFAALGIATEKITLVFRQQLVRDLRQPRFASAWNDLLNLRIDCYPFQPITLARIFGEGNRVNAFAPTRDEYLNGRVYRSVVTSEVENYLEHEGWALVRGLGAAGKTVLAVHIAVGNRFSGNPVYYLDLTTFGPDKWGQVYRHRQMGSSLPLTLAQN